MNVVAPVAACAGVDRRRFRRAVAAHFAGHIGVEDERALRMHIPDCPSCKQLYNRALLLARTDPRGVIARERLAQGLGLGRAARSRRWRLSLGRAWAAPALAGLALVVFGLVAGAPRPPSAPPAARGAVQVAAPALLAYRIPPRGSPRAIEDAGGVIDGNDELAFAYSNPGAWPYLMIFAVDEHARVYWYQPTWRVGAPPPVSIRARAGAGPHELPSATRHSFDGRRLLVYAVFTRQALGVETIELAARQAGGPDRLAFPNDFQIVRRTIEVAP